MQNWDSKAADPCGNESAFFDRRLLQKLDPSAAI